MNTRKVSAIEQGAVSSIIMEEIVKILVDSHENDKHPMSVESAKLLIYGRILVDIPQEHKC